MSVAHQRVDVAVVIQYLATLSISTICCHLQLSFLMLPCHANANMLTLALRLKYTKYQAYQVKFLVCANLLGNKFDSDSDK